MKSTIIETERLLLRNMDWDDLNALALYLQDERVMYAYNGAFSNEETEEWMRRQIRRYEDYGFGAWAVVLKETGEMIGQCGITMQDYNGKEVPEIGYLLAFKYWHKGYATEAAVACKEYGFNTLHIDTLYSIIRDTNHASRRVAVRNGMRPVGTLMKHYRGVDMLHIVYSTQASGK